MYTAYFQVLQVNTAYYQASEVYTAYQASEVYTAYQASEVYTDY